MALNNLFPWTPRTGDPDPKENFSTLGKWLLLLKNLAIDKITALEKRVTWNDTRINLSLKANQNRYYTSQWPTITGLISHIGSATARIIVNSTVTLAANLTVPSNITLVDGGGYFVLGNYNLTIGMKPNWGDRLAFSYTGTGVTSFSTPIEVNVKWWGATGDGASVDTNAVQYALNAAGRNGSCYFPHTDAGYLSGQLTLSQSIVTIRGAGGGWSSSNAFGLRYNATSGDFLVLNGSHIIFKDMVIDGNGTSDRVLSFAAGFRNRVERATIRNSSSSTGPFNGTGVYFGDAGGQPECGVFDSIIQNCDIPISSVNGDGFIERNIIINASTSWVKLTQSSGWHIYDNKVYNTNGNRYVTGFDLQQAAFLSMCRNEIEVTGDGTNLSKGVKIAMAAQLGNVFADNTLFTDSSMVDFLEFSAGNASNFCVLANNNFQVKGWPTPTYTSCRAVVQTGSYDVIGYAFGNGMIGFTTAGNTQFDTSIAKMKVFPLGNSKITEVSATPESSLVGNIGDIAIRNDVGLIYQKISGSGNTGWSALLSSSSPAFTGTMTGPNISLTGTFHSDGNIDHGGNAVAGFSQTINGAAGNNRSRIFQTAGVNRFIDGVENSAESGADAGSDWRVAWYNDAGTFQGNSIQVRRGLGGTVLFGNGALVSSSSKALGYATGAGGTVTQGSGSGKATGVTLSRPSGQITMDGAALAAGTVVSFTLTNTTIAATDILDVNHASIGNLGDYSIMARCAAGSATISVRNVTAGSLSEAIVIGFVLHKGATT